MRKTVFHFAAALTFAASVVLHAQTPAAEHGSLDVYVKDGIVLAWAVVRDQGSTDPETDRVILRMVFSSGSAGAVSVQGVDPFTGERMTIFSGTLTGPMVDVATPRGRFALHPKTEIFFYGSEEAFRAGKPSRQVYFLGLPDTAPEFLDHEKALAYLEKRTAEAR